MYLSTLLRQETPAEGIIEKLFRGRTTSYIQCVDINFTSSRSEEYYGKGSSEVELCVSCQKSVLTFNLSDLSLIVKGCKNVYESFEQYVEVELLDGANQYHAEGYGLQNAKKGCKFESLPPVLQLQLKRFEYDPYRDANVKLNDRYEFPAELNLSKYLEEVDAESAANTIYDLYG
jgi:ubiquitin carboxyl-terminal hydrolase 7